MKELFALTILRVIQLSFRTQPGFNPDVISLENRFGNKIYISKRDNHIEISVYKVTKRCNIITIANKDEIEKVADTIKQKIKTDDYGSSN